jgi:hypothetical protein
MRWGKLISALPDAKVPPPKHSMNGGLSMSPRAEAVLFSDDVNSEIEMEDFIRRESLIIFRRRLALAKDDAQRQLLLKLLAEEEKIIPCATR